MPRAVDQEARRRDIAEAVMRLVGSRGLAAASIRAVAAEAGVSVGAVQRCFHSREAMMTFTLGQVNVRLTERFQARVARLPAPATPRDLLRAVLIELVPLDDETRVEARGGLAFLAMAAEDAALAPIVRDTWYAGALDFFRRQLTALHDAAGLAPGTDPELAAHETQVLVEGLRAPLVLGHLSPDQARALLDQHLHRLFDGA
ncbi:TetR/AcrR family transcriptional regulator [Pseudofrankia inefficax]|uniref:Regulatory protein TetR n=1 Tax=Pseudofrankia inefficax (strain DSM 45817 / CECT 9037 / DDB 130130 / EuI1c) TaxID=298654 RepID=E3J404_PSEI1|nr:TetR family transcriptional regulator C-terminal domain-containing protein [Pseudofrankia inefficax]ADP80637.1 regulatory protein TetR [Pseudofrankia inefficax]